MESLQNSPEVRNEDTTCRSRLYTHHFQQSNSTRAKNLELFIQERVTAELEKLLASSSDNLSSVSEALSKDPSADESGPSLTEKPLVNRLAEKLGGGDSTTQDEKEQIQQETDRHAVQKEIDSLRQKLNGRKKLVEVDKDVEKAKNDVISCLKTNDRRPLDCWKEVEKFKVEVARMEKTFMNKSSA